MKDAKLLVDVGNSAYKAAQAKDGNALGRACRGHRRFLHDCHKQYRPNVFRKTEGRNELFP